MNGQCLNCGHYELSHYREDAFQVRACLLCKCVSLDEDGFRVHTYKSVPLIMDTQPDPNMSLVLCKCGKSPCKHNPEVVSYWAVGEHRPMTKAMLFYLHFKDSPEPENIPNIDDWEPGE